MEDSPMKKIVALITTISLMGLLSASTVTAQPRMGRGSGGWGMGSPYQRLYNPKTLATLTGEVVAIDSVMPMGGMTGGVHLKIRTSTNQVMSVHLGPSWYLENQEVAINVKDKIQVKGSKVTFAGAPALIAAEVKKGDQTLTLRDTNGFPMWSGWRRRSM
jgi:hypothetical protein